MIPSSPALSAEPLEPPARDARHVEVVRVDGLTKRFPTRRRWRELLRHPLQKPVWTTVVNRVSFGVREAEFFGLLGANGAGKTTLFKMLATQLLPDAGTATVAGRDVERSPREVRRLLTPVIADERSLYWRLTARQNLELFAALYGLTGPQADTRIDELLHVVELDETSLKMVGAFSSGMKQRLLIARALLARPRVLLLDEPTRSLDPLSARRFRRFLREEIAGRQRCAVLLATHSAEEAFELCDRVAILDHGALVTVGRVPDLMARVRDDGYRLSVRSGQVPALERLVRPAALRVRDEDAPGWTVVEMRIPSGAEGAAATLARISSAGIGVSRFERTGLSLADLLDRFVGERGESAHG